MSLLSKVKTKPVVVSRQPQSDTIVDRPMVFTRAMGEDGSGSIPATEDTLFHTLAMGEDGVSCFPAEGYELPEGGKFEPAEGPVVFTMALGEDGAIVEPYLPGGVDQGEGFVFTRDPGTGDPIDGTDPNMPVVYTMAIGEDGMGCGLADEAIFHTMAIGEDGATPYTGVDQGEGFVFSREPGTDAPVDGVQAGGKQPIIPRLCGTITTFPEDMLPVGPDGVILDTAV